MVFCRGSNDDRTLETSHNYRVWLDLDSSNGHRPVSTYVQFQSSVDAYLAPVGRPHSEAHFWWGLLAKLIYCPWMKRHGMDVSTNSITNSIANRSDACAALSSKIWAHPELMYQEHRAHQLLTDFLEKEQFDVYRGYAGVSTAFRAEFQSSRFMNGAPGTHATVAILCEYDALPEIGHACGHNLIAGSSATLSGGLLSAKVFCVFQKLGSPPLARSRMYSKDLVTVPKAR